MRVLVVGNGGREHALVWKIRQSRLVKEIYCAPGNAGIAEIADCVPIDTSNIVEVADFAQTIGADLTVVGPELPMVLGIADEFQRRHMQIFAPTAAAAEIEGSKAFARDFMKRHDVPAPRYEICPSLDEALDFVKRAPFGYPMVIKADGLASGKGTVLADDVDAARTAVERLMSSKKLGKAGAKLVMEEHLEGEEISFLVLSDGSRVVPLVSAQDHKRVGDGDTGPNTGGMGTISPATNLKLDDHKRVMQEIIVPTIAGLAEEGRRFQGVLYAGLMITPEGPKVLEFNARFGDPECQVMVTRMGSDLVPLLVGAANGQFEAATMTWIKEPAACVVLASRGYPDGPVETGKRVAGLDTLKGEKDVVVFHAATQAEGDEIVTVGGRVLGVTAVAGSMQAAIARAYEAVDKVSFEGMHYRRDIGYRALARMQAAR